MSSIDVLMSIIIDKYFASVDKEYDLTSVFTNFVDFEVKRRLPQRIIKGDPAFKKYSKLSIDIKKIQEIRNKFAHCPYTSRYKLTDL